jgi:alpha-galactosidase
MARIALIGAGSVQFTRTLLVDLLSFPDLAGSTIVLHDIDPDRLSTAEAIARRVRERLDAPATVEGQPDRRRALDEADYVVNEIQVGGYAATRIDFEIPARHGVRQTIGDTIGIGGIFRGLRTIPVLLEIGREMAELCPDAWLLNYTNPMAMLPWAVHEGSAFRRVLGLCHGVPDTRRQLASCAGLSPDVIGFLAAGLNHQSHVLRFEHQGQDLYPLLDEAIGRGEPFDPLRVELYRRFGYWPTVDREHTAECLPWVMRHDALIRRFDVPVDEYLRRSERSLAAYEETRRDLERGHEIELHPGRDLAALVIGSLETGQELEVYGNVRNGDLIENLPPECCVEVPCRVADGRIEPVPVGRLPAQLAALNRTFVNVCELTVRAVLDGRRDHVYQAALLDPNTAATLRLDEILVLVDELIEAHGEAIPEPIRTGRARSRAGAASGTA